jgi:hypothetical protein
MYYVYEITGMSMVVGDIVVILLNIQSLKIHNTLFCPDGYYNYYCFDD